MEAAERRAIAISILDGCAMRKPHKHYTNAKIALKIHRDGKHVSGKVWSQCKKKTAYSTYRMAIRAANNALTVRGAIVRVYQCPHCNKYHLSKHFRNEQDKV